MSKDNVLLALELIPAIPRYYDLLPLMLEKGGLTYADIGTTEEAVDQMYVAACKAKAEAALEKLLHGCWSDTNFAQYESQIWDWMHRASLLHLNADGTSKNGTRLTLADLGTTKETIEEVMGELRHLLYYKLDSNFPWREPVAHFYL